MSYLHASGRCSRKCGLEGSALFTLSGRRAFFSAAVVLPLQPDEMIREALDLSFVRAIEAGKDAPIVDAMISMGRSLGLLVVAEGVETEIQREYLTRKGCSQLQGYLISRPVGAAELAAWSKRINVGLLGQPEGLAQGVVTAMRRGGAATEMALSTGPRRMGGHRRSGGAGQPQAGDTGGHGSGVAETPAIVFHGPEKAGNHRVEQLRLLQIARMACPGENRQAR